TIILFWSYQLKFFNNYELATTTLITLAFIIGMCFPLIRNSLGSVIKAFFQSKIVSLVTLFLAYIATVLYGLYLIELWDFAQFKNSILWFVLIGCVQLFGLTKVISINEFIKTSLKKQVQWIVLLELLISFRHLPYEAEVIIILLIFIFSLLKVTAENNPEHWQVVNVCSSFLNTIGLIIITSAVLHIISDTDKFLSFSTVQVFLIPIILTIVSLPYFYCVHRYITYESAFVITKIYTNSFRLRQYAKYKSFIAFKGDHTIIKDWLMFSCMSEFESKASISESIDTYKTAISN
ncbi:hypothetical protein, partial [Psychromonas sp. Urea-02u-13]|uniref:hypothetical protein n=1 Tax=Psychromonas sp. Urea-02u-13 TaxID=2058326 RepID=UPI000CB52103